MATVLEGLYLAIGLLSVPGLLLPLLLGYRAGWPWGRRCLVLALLLCALGVVLSLFLP